MSHKKTRLDYLDDLSFSYDGTCLIMCAEAYRPEDVLSSYSLRNFKYLFD